jgi:DNA modification methylase
MGSGTTASACETLERRWIGSEISSQYCDVAKRRIIKQTAPELFFERGK